MKHFLLEKKINRLLRNREVDIDKEKIQSVGVLVGPSSIGGTIEKELKEFTQSINIAPSNLKFLYHTKSNNKKKNSSNKSKEIQINCLGSIKDIKAQEFLDYEFDLLLTICSKKNLEIGYLTARSRAKFKIGFNNIDDRLFDLILQFKDSKTMTKDIEAYLKVMGKI